MHAVFSVFYEPSNCPYALLNLASAFLRRKQPENKNDPSHSQKNYFPLFFCWLHFVFDPPQIHESEKH